MIYIVPNGQAQLQRLVGHSFVANYPRLLKPPDKIIEGYGAG